MLYIKTDYWYLGQKQHSKYAPFLCSSGSHHKSVCQSENNFCAIWYFVLCFVIQNPRWLVQTHMRTRDQANDEVSRWQRKYLHVKLINFIFCRWLYRVNTHTHSRLTFALNLQLNRFKLIIAISVCSLVDGVQVSVLFVCSTVEVFSFFLCSFFVVRIWENLCCTNSR